MLWTGFGKIYKLQKIMSEIVQSAWWIVYFFDEKNEPKYLIIKRLALSNKIERVAPKWKVNVGETIEQTVLREVSEETWIPINKMFLKQMVWTAELRSTENKWNLKKDITYFLVEYKWEPNDVLIQDWEWFIWVYKWATLKEILGLIYYQNIRELFRKAHNMILQKTEKQEAKKDFISKYLK